MTTTHDVSLLGRTLPTPESPAEHVERVLHHARCGDIASLQEELDSGEPGGSLALTYAVLPLGNHRQNLDAQMLLERWLRAGGDSAARRNHALRLFQATDVITSLLQLGADPNCFRCGPFTPLGESVRAGSVNKTHLLLRTLVERGLAPMVSSQCTLFDWMLRHDDARNAQLADNALASFVSSDELPSRRVSEAFCYAAGNALHIACTGLHPADQASTFLRKLRLMAFARLRPNGFSDRWIRILQHGHGNTIADWILKQRNEPLAVSILENLAGNAFNLDSHLRFQTLGASRPMPLLHAAVKCQHPGLVACLLRLGANARLPALVNESLVTPITLAKRVGATECIALLSPFERGNLSGNLSAEFPLGDSPDAFRSRALRIA